MRSTVAYQLFQSSSFVVLGGRGALPRGGGINNTIGAYLPEVDFPSSRSTVYFREGLGGCIFHYAAALLRPCPIPALKLHLYHSPPFFSPRFPSIHLTLRHADSPHAAYCQIKLEKLIFHSNWRMCAPRAAPKFKCRSKNCLSRLRKRSGFAPPRRACQAHLGLEARVGAKDQITRTLGAFPGPPGGPPCAESLSLTKPPQQLCFCAPFQILGGSGFGVGI